MGERGIATPVDVSSSSIQRRIKVAFSHALIPLRLPYYMCFHWCFSLLCFMIPAQDKKHVDPSGCLMEEIEQNDLELTLVTFKNIKFKVINKMVSINSKLANHAEIHQRLCANEKNIFK